LKYKVSGATRPKASVYSLGLGLLGSGKDVSVLLHGGDTSGGLGVLASGFLSGGVLGDGLLGLVNGELGNGSSLSGGDLTGGLLGGSLGSSGGLSGGGGGGLLGRGSFTEGDGLGVSGLEVPVVGGSLEDVLGDGSLVSVNRSSGHVHTGGGSGGLSESVLLDGGLELIISVEVGGVSGEGSLVVHHGLEFLDDESDLKSGVRGPDLVGVNSSELEVPLGDEDDLSGEGVNGDGSELGVEVNGGLGGEVSGDEELGVGDEEVRGGFLNVKLELSIEVSLVEFLNITTVLDHVGEEGLESRCHILFLFSLNYS
jgi:hypothetical protein